MICEFEISRSRAEIAECCRAESAEDAKGRGSGRVARAGDDGAGDPVAPALLGVLSVLRAKYSAIFARD